MIVGNGRTADKIYGGQKSGTGEVSDLSVSLELLIVLRVSLVSLASLIYS